MVEEVHGGRPWLGLNRAHLSESPSWMLARQGPAQGERGYGGVLLSSSLSNAAILYCGSAFCHNIPIYRAPPSLPFLQDVSSWTTAVLCLVCSLDPTFQHPALVCSGGHPLRLGGQGRGQYTVYRSRSVLLPQTVGVFSSHRE